MRKNMGRPDRGLRVLVAAGAVAGSGVVGFTTAWGIVLLVVAALMVATSASGSCALYSVLRLDTRRPRCATPDEPRVRHMNRAA